ncbi:MAG TPA: DUF3800 domain-containing protein [Cryptosporangiaceae bacterium]|nr:DUF3800 domain-containing protein [Cryptosporangiaceae bacterium]
MSTKRLHAFIDEAGQRSRSPRSSDHFVMSAVVVPDNHLATSSALLSQLRSDLGRNVNHVLHWRNLKHAERVHIARQLGEQSWLQISNVVVCKRALTGATLNDDQAYLYTFRFLLERLSWLARDTNHMLSYTLAHVVRFKIGKLRQYEANLRLTPGCQIAWQVIDGPGGHLDQPSRIEQLQLADAAASATWAAFERDKFGNTERRYLELLAPRLYRRGDSPLTSYGLKLHPYTADVRAAYPWVAALEARRPA